MDEQTLYRCAQAMTGATLGELARKHNNTIPPHLQRHKGWVGHLIEQELGIPLNAEDGPDFPTLGIELKTLPVNMHGDPLESTYICTAPFGPQDFSWEHSRVYRKIARVLWIPVEGTAQLPLAARRIGPPLLWSPPPTIARVLAQDWEDLTTALAVGEISQLSARQGKYLQIRPKAAHARIHSSQLHADGTLSTWVPRGFYLRRTCTQQIVRSSWMHQAFFRPRISTSSLPEG